MVARRTIKYDLESGLLPVSPWEVYRLPNHFVVTNYDEVIEKNLGIHLCFERFQYCETWSPRSFLRSITNKSMVSLTHLFGKYRHRVQL